MREAHYAFDVVPSTVTEPAWDGAVEPGAYAEYLAGLKADDVAEKYPRALVIGADTIVVHGDAIVGKPVDRADARRMLRDLFAGVNTVITGLAICCAAQKIRTTAHEATTLVMRAMNDQQIQAYLDSGAWEGKAGAYAIQEGGDAFVESMRGSWSNVVGLGMERLERMLEAFVCR